MGLFTNRKRDEEADLADRAEAARMLSQFNSAPEQDDGAAAPIAENETFTSESETQLPNRRLEDRPRAQAGNVEIDAGGLLDMLGVGASAGLLDISAAHQRFLADHQPVDSDEADTAELKEAIRREVNTAYASFRLTHTA